MKEDCGNIYRNARKAAGLTQERWAEYLGISVEAVRQYENGAILPELEEQKGLPEAVLGLLIGIDDFKTTGLPQLLRIAADGKVSRDEEEAYKAAVSQMMELVRLAYACGYAKE